MVSCNGKLNRLNLLQLYSLASIYNGLYNKYGCYILRIKSKVGIGHHEKHNHICIVIKPCVQYSYLYLSATWRGTITPADRLTADNLSDN